MPISYRYIVVALAGLTLAAGPTSGNNSKRKLNETSQEIGQTLKNIAASNEVLAKATDTGEYQKPCRHDARDNQSDLCAQWTAANAATEAARWAWWSMLVGSFGTVGVLITIIQASKSYTTQYRPWLALDNLKVDHILTGAGLDGLASFLFSGKIANIGQTAAGNVQIYLSIDKISRTYTRLDTIIPATSGHFDILNNLPLRDAVDANGVCKVFIEIEYSSLGQRKKHYLSQHWQLASQIFKGTIQTLNRGDLEQGGSFQAEAKLVATRKAT